MTALVLDSKAFSRLARARSGQAPGRVLAALNAASERGSDILVPAAVLAEQYRGGQYDQTVDSCLGRYTGIEVADTTRALARTIGNLLARSHRGSEDHVDAAVVAATLAAGGGVILTDDTDDLGDIADGLPGVRVESI